MRFLSIPTRPLALLLVLAAAPAAGQPAPADPISPAGYRPGVDVLDFRFRLALSDASDRIEGEAAVTVRFTTAELPALVLDLVAPDAPGSPGMTVSAVTEDGTPVPFSQSDGRLHVPLAT